MPEKPNQLSVPGTLLVLVISVLGGQIASADPLQGTGSNPPAVEAILDQDFNRPVPAIALQGYAGFRKIAEAELRSQLPREQMLALISKVEGAARNGGMDDAELVALTQHGLAEGAKLGLWPPLIFENIAVAILRTRK
jgi:hypothetical protein